MGNVGDDRSRRANRAVEQQTLSTKFDSGRDIDSLRQNSIRRADFRIDALETDPGIKSSQHLR